MSIGISDFDIWQLRETQRIEYAEYALEAAAIDPVSLKDTVAEFEINWNKQKNLASIMKYGLGKMYLMDFEHHDLTGVYDRDSGKKLSIGLTLDQSLQTLRTVYNCLNSKDKERIKIILPQMLNLS